jgi:anaerobic selenocysteine-containing dehydrogenase
LELTIVPKPDGVGETVKVIRGDSDDVFSAGFVCPKGTTLGHLHEDPDWLRQPVVNRDGEFVPVSWDEAFAAIEEGLMPLVAEHGRDAVAVYLGNPGAHSLALMLYNRTLLHALGSRNRFSASTVDQRPKEISTSMMFGSVTVPVPDLDRTDFIVLLGANPYASNGSLCTAPDFPGRLERIQARGGQVVVVDPRRSETAERADQHLAIRPGTDAHLLAALVHVMFEEGIADAGSVAEHCAGFDELPSLVQRFDADTAAAVCGIEADTIRELARSLVAHDRAVVYGRIGTCTQEFGTLASWFVDVVNVCSGNLDTVGGAMFARGATGQPSTKGAPGTGRGFVMGRVHTRVSGAPESLGEFPVSALPEEIETPGEGQVRALITIAGNPISSNPNTNRLDAALGSLEFMVSVDPYINETTRHADVILPPPTPLQKSHFDLAFVNFSVRNVANYSPAVFPLEDTQLDEATIMLRLAGLVAGAGFAPDTAAIEGDIARSMVAAAVRDEHSNVFGRDVDELLAMVGERSGPERLLDIMLRVGPYGDGFGADPDGLTLAVLEANPHGVDLGELEPGRVPANLRTPSGRIELTPQPLVDDLARLEASLDRDWETSLVLVGRRHVRSNNSWMHNIRVLTKGRNRCTLQMHPADAAERGIEHGDQATVTSRVGSVTLPVDVTDGIRPGVVSIPHGFGQDMPGVQLDVATAYGGVNTNLLTDEYFSDALSGNIALNGVPVTVAPAAAAAVSAAV